VNGEVKKRRISSLGRRSEDEDEKRKGKK